MALVTDPKKDLLSKIPPKPSPTSQPVQTGGLKNVIDVYRSIFTGKGVVATSKLQNAVGKPVASIIATGASHPFLTAGVVTGGVYATKALSSGVASKAITGGAVAGGSLAGFKSTAIAGGAGFIAGSMMGEKTAQMQSATVEQTPQQGTYSTVSNINKSFTYSPQDVRYNIQNSPGAQISGSPSQAIRTEQLPYTGISPYQGFSSDLGQGQTSSSTSWLLVALVGIGAFMLAKR